MWVLASAPISNGRAYQIQHRRRGAVHLNLLMCVSS